MCPKSTVPDGVVGGGEVADRAAPGREPVDARDGGGAPPLIEPFEPMVFEKKGSASAERRDACVVVIVVVIVVDIVGAGGGRDFRTFRPGNSKSSSCSRAGNIDVMVTRLATLCRSATGLPAMRTMRRSGARERTRRWRRSPKRLWERSRCVSDGGKPATVRKALCW